MSEGVELLREAVERLLAESPTDLPGPAALARLRTLLACTEQLQAVQLSAVRDLDRRQLYALDAAGSARGWLRRQPGGQDGQVTLARRLAQRPAVQAALTDARIGLRGATQLCTALEAVPTDLDDALVRAVVQDGIGRLLLEQTGGTPEHTTAATAVLAQRQADASVLAACCADPTAAPDARLEPAFVLLAERLSPGQLGAALRLLLQPLHPDGTDTPPPDPYYLELRILADGDVDRRGLLDPETGHSLAAEIQRRLDAARTAAAQARRTSHPDTADEDEAAPDLPDTDLPDTGLPDSDPLLLWDQAMADADARAARRATQPGGDRGRADRGPDAPQRLISTGRRRHDALRDLLTDAASAPPGEPPHAHLTVLATLEAVEGRLGAPPAQLLSVSGRSVHLRPETLQRLGCSSELDAVLLDAHGHPVGASSTRRMPNRRERRALRARWGPHCAVAGCPHTRTVPHHVIPWWLSGLTRLADLVPLCTSCHHDLHEGHRTLRLRDSRLIDDHGWVSVFNPTAA